MNKTETRVALVGGGSACCELLSRFFAAPNQSGWRIVGVADPNPQAPGLDLARHRGIELTTNDFRQLLSRSDIDLVIDLTGDPEVRREIQTSLAPNIQYCDFLGSRFLWDIFAGAGEKSLVSRTTEPSLEADRNRLRNILDSLPYEILVINQDYRVELANRTFLANNRLVKDTVLGKYCYDLDHKTKGPCDISLDGCPHARTLEGGQSIATVVSHMDPQGNEHFAAVRSAPILSEDGRTLGAVEAIRDITQRVQIEEELKETRARLNQFIDTAPLFVYMKNAKHQYLVINRHGLEILGLTESDVVGRTDFALFPDSVAREIQAREREVLRTGKTVRAEGRLPVHKGDLDYTATLFPVQKGKKVIGLFGLIEDRTELHKSEEQLHQEQERLFETRKYLAGILEQSRDMIFLTTPTGKLLSFNRGAEEVLGYEAAAVMGHDIAEYASDPATFQDLIGQSLKDGHAVAYEVPFQRSDGETSICNVSLTRIDTPDGQPIEMVGICRNLTTRLMLREDLIRSERLAAVGKMAAGVAHEINNPLAIMDTIAGLIRETLAEEKENLHPGAADILDKAAARLAVQVKRCMNITHSLLGFVRKSEAGRREVEIPNLLEEALNLLAAEIHNVGVEIRRNFSRDLPRPVTDPMLLEQVFVNLLSNAIEAIEEKGEVGLIEIQVTAEVDRVIVSIWDNGVGIPVETRDKIFDLFHTSKPVGKGTGLGLAIVHDILKRLNSNIEVESEPGHWTRFAVTVPLRASS